jgi:hypothetical protein
MRKALLLASSIALVACGGTIDSSRQPFYADPLFDSAHDAEFVWSELEQTWWITYLQNRYNVPSTEPAGPCAYCSYTDIGLASTPDNGATWVYRGVARGLDLPLELRHDHTNPGTQQFGGATWYRPAVLKIGDVYHGFWVYWEPRMGLLGNSAIGQGIVHYQSQDLKNWTYAGVVGGDTGYDSVVFQIADGRYILLSTHSQNATTYQSTDLKTWVPTTDPGLHLSTGEGPHVVDFKGHKWLNAEGSQLRRSDDGGLHWVDLTGPEQSLWPFTGSGSRRYDIGLMHQGPLFVQGEPPNERAFYLYFTEFPLNGTWCLERGLQTQSDMDTFGYLQNGCERSMLQLAEVHYAPNIQGGALTVNRNESFSFTMVPPPNRSRTTRVQNRPTVWHVSKEDAMVIALAELNRWVPGALYDLSICSEATLPIATSGQPTCGPPPPPKTPGCNLPSCVKNTIVDNFRIAAGFYTTYSRPTAEECVSECVRNASRATNPCTATIWKSPNATGLSSCGGIGSPCCYFMSVPGRELPSNCGGACATAWQWKSWSSVGLELQPAAASSRRLANPQRMWRNPDLAHRYFSSVVTGGVGAALVFKLQFESQDATTKLLLNFSFVVHGNGTILKVQNSTSGVVLQPIMQFYRPTVGPGPSTAS